MTPLCDARGNFTFKFYKRSLHPFFRNYYDYNHHRERSIYYVALGPKREKTNSALTSSQNIKNSPVRQIVIVSFRNIIKSVQ